MKVRKLFGLALGVTISGAFLWLIFRSIPIKDILAVVRRAEAVWLLAGLGFFILGYASRIWRWRLMLASYNAALGWGRCSVPFMASIAANNVLPFRAGDVLRGVAFSGWLGVPTARVLATLLVERLLDMLCLIIALAVVLGLFSSGGAGIQALFGWSAWFFALAAGAIALILLFPRVFEPPVLWLVRAPGRRAGKFSHQLEVQVQDVFQTLSALATRARMATMIFWSFLAWTFEACVFYATARALPDIAAPVAAWVAMPVGTLSTMLPSTPGYIGTFHYFVMKTAELLGNPEVAAVAFALLVHLMLYIPATLWGGASVVYWIITGPVVTSPATRAAPTN